MAKFKNEEGQELGLDDILQDAEYQAEFDKKVAKAIEKSKGDIDAEVQKKLDAALAGREEEIRKNIQEEMDKKAKEAEELAKMTEAEKFKKQLDQVNQELLDTKNKLAIADREKKMKSYIKEKNYNADILDLVKPENVTDANFEGKLDEINEKLTAAVSKELNEKLKENPDKILGDKNGNKGPQFDFGFQSIKPEGGK